MRPCDRCTQAAIGLGVEKMNEETRERRPLLVDLGLVCNAARTGRGEPPLSFEVFREQETAYQRGRCAAAARHKAELGVQRARERLRRAEAAVAAAAAGSQRQPGAPPLWWEWELVQAAHRRTAA